MLLKSVFVTSTVRKIARSLCTTVRHVSRDCRLQCEITHKNAPVIKNVKCLAVIGGGQMGTGIGITAARRVASPHIDTEEHEIPKSHRSHEQSQSTLQTVMIIDVNNAQLSKSEAFVDKWIAKEVSKNRMSVASGELMKASMQFLHMQGSKTGESDVVITSLSSSFIPWSSVDFVIEAASEVLSLKQRIFSAVGEQTRPDVVIASNTSSISITKLAACTNKPHNVIGMHFMNPVPVMPLVEIITGLSTSQETLHATVALAAVMGKVTAKSLDRPGFVSNRVLMPYINEAIFTLQEGISTEQDIDTIMKLGTNVPMGPLTLADFIGLDTCLNVMKVLHTELGDSKYRPAPLLTQYVDAGWLGKKVGRGFYEYQDK
eukprot:GHVQ01023683.1.p2 GENE.GHVQ01023683.1~~GHVQ01023683.1.p2  ORF type:complete len:374 (+),score=35.86 GHVQ01023683.1:1901-3022(+)